LQDKDKEAARMGTKAQQRCNATRDHVDGGAGRQARTRQWLAKGVKVTARRPM
jgi:hypothetical protein